MRSMAFLICSLSHRSLSLSLLESKALEPSPSSPWPLTGLPSSSSVIEEIEMLWLLVLSALSRSGRIPVVECGPPVDVDGPDSAPVAEPLGVKGGEGLAMS
uniref:(northern house mosquito) hypothetical protein n=1 Tax=Culex pipiens TaxID=7175 RepID=A0A8D8K329_CULPI